MAVTCVLVNYWRKSPNFSSCLLLIPKRSQMLCYNWISSKVSLIPPKNVPEV